MIFDAKRPAILNGIGDIIERTDLLERALLIRHPAIPEGDRQLESQYWAAFKKVHPQLLGAVLDRVAAGLRELPKVELDRLPRMADFALFAVACERGAGEDPRFLAAYRDNQAGANELALESSPIVAPLLACMAKRDGWEGSASQLLELLTAELPTQPTPTGTRPIYPNGWPKRPHDLGNVLQRLAPNLRRVQGVGHRSHTDKAGSVHSHQLRTRKYGGNVVTLVTLVTHPRKPSCFARNELFSG